MHARLLGAASLFCFLFIVVAGKLTLATRLGDRSTRWFYVALVAFAALNVVVFAAMTNWWVLGALAAFGLAVPAVRRMLAGARGRDLIPLLRATSLTELLMAFGLLVGVVMG